METEIKKPKKTVKTAEPKAEIAEKKTQIKTETTNNLIAIIRIAGQVKVKSEIKNTLDRLRMRRKYVCVLINSNNESLMGMLNKVRFSVAFGIIKKDTLVKLLEARGRKASSSEIENSKSAAKSDYEKIAEELMKGKNLEELGIKPFFRLHPPRKGIKSKLQYNRGGVLGDNKESINKLIERML